LSGFRCAKLAFLGRKRMLAAMSRLNGVPGWSQIQRRRPSPVVAYPVGLIAGVR
jgi:hypothetical protein